MSIETACPGGPSRKGDCRFRPPLEAQLQITEIYNIGIYHARISSGKTEADVFIQKADWEELTPLQQRAIRQNLAWHGG